MTNGCVGRIRQSKTNFTSFLFSILCYGNVELRRYLNFSRMKKRKYISLFIFSAKTLFDGRNWKNMVFWRWFHPFSWCNAWELLSIQWMAVLLHWMRLLTGFNCLVHSHSIHHLLRIGYTYFNTALEIVFVWCICVHYK